MATNYNVKLITLAFAASAVLAVTTPPLSADTIKQKLDGGSKLFTIEVMDADVSDVLRALAQQRGINLVIGSGVSGTVTLSYKDIEFKDALESIVRASRLGYSLKNNVLWVGPKDDVATVGDELEEIITIIIPLNYASPGDITDELKGVLSPKGYVGSDLRTNTIIIKDYKRHLDDARQVISALDKRSRQVVIEARIVEASSTYARQLGIRWGGLYSSGSDSVGGASALSTSSGGRNFAVDLPTASATGGVGIIIGSLSDNLILDAELTAAERDGKLRIVSRPKITAINNKEASIHSGLTYRVKLDQSIVSGSASSISQQGLEEIRTGIDLFVTPQISPDGYVELKIVTTKSDADFSRTVDGIPGIAEKRASTHVIVKDGNTVVIGGLLKNSSSNQDDSVPFLSKIPLFGWLFKSKSDTSDSEELLVFITPTIVRQTSSQEVVD